MSLIHTSFTYSVLKKGKSNDEVFGLQPQTIHPMGSVPF